MRNKKGNVLLALSISTIMLVATGLVVAADSEDVDQAGEEAQIEFEIPNNIVIPPYDPESPEEELPEDEGHVVLPPGGPLHLQVVPRFNFGIHDVIADVGGTYDHIPPYHAHLVMVWDHRHVTEMGDGTPAGWRVYAEMKSEFEHRTLELTLPGSQIKFTGIQTSGTGGQVGSKPPTNFGGAGTLEYDENANSRVFIGGAFKGEGGWNTHIAFGPHGEDIQLDIPTSTSVVAGIYTAVIEWTLTTAPTNPGQ